MSCQFAPRGHTVLTCLVGNLQWLCLASHVQNVLTGGSFVFVDSDAPMDDTTRTSAPSAEITYLASV